MIYPFQLAINFGNAKDCFLPIRYKLAIFFFLEITYLLSFFGNVLLPL